MKQIVRILFALGALIVLTIYFFSGLVLIEPTPQATGASSSGSPTLNVPAHDDRVTSDEVNALVNGSGPLLNAAGSGASVFRGLTGGSGGVISSFKASWQSMYSRWPMGKKTFRNGGRPMSGDSIVLHERIGNFLTLISLALAVGAISLGINLVEEKARV